MDSDAAAAEENQDRTTEQVAQLEKEDLKQTNGDSATPLEESPAISSPEPPAPAAESIKNDQTLTPSDNFPQEASLAAEQSVANEDEVVKPSEVTKDGLASEKDGEGKHTSGDDQPPDRAASIDHLEYHPPKERDNEEQDMQSDPVESALNLRDDAAEEGQDNDVIEVEDEDSNDGLEDPPSLSQKPSVTPEKSGIRSPPSLRTQPAAREVDVDLPDQDPGLIASGSNMGDDRPVEVDTFKDDDEANSDADDDEEMKDFTAAPLDRSGSESDSGDSEQYGQPHISGQKQDRNADEPIDLTASPPPTKFAAPSNHSAEAEQSPTEQFLINDSGIGDDEVIELDGDDDDDEDGEEERTANEDEGDVDVEDAEDPEKEESNDDRDDDTKPTSVSKPGSILEIESRTETAEEDVPHVEKIIENKAGPPVSRKEAGESETDAKMSTEKDDLIHSTHELHGDATQEASKELQEDISGVKGLEAKSSGSPPKGLEAVAEALQEEPSLTQDKDSPVRESEEIPLGRENTNETQVAEKSDSPLQSTEKKPEVAENLSPRKEAVDARGEQEHKSVIAVPLHGVRVDQSEEQEAPKDQPEASKPTGEKFAAKPISSPTTTSTDLGIESNKVVKQASVPETCLKEDLPLKLGGQRTATDDADSTAMVAKSDAKEVLSELHPTPVNRGMSSEAVIADGETDVVMESAAEGPQDKEGDKSDAAIACAIVLDPEELKQSDSKVVESSPHDDVKKETTKASSKPLDDPMVIDASKENTETHKKDPPAGDDDSMAIDASTENTETHTKDPKAVDPGASGSFTAPMFGFQIETPNKPVSFSSPPSFQRSNLSPSAPPFVPASLRNHQPSPLVISEPQTKDTVERIESGKAGEEKIGHEGMGAAEAKTQMPAVPQKKVAFLLPTEHESKQDEAASVSIKIPPQEKKIEKKADDGEQKVYQVQTDEGRRTEVTNVAFSVRIGGGKIMKRESKSVVRLTVRDGESAKLEFFQGTGSSMRIWESLSSSHDSVRIRRVKNQPYCMTVVKLGAGGSEKADDSKKYFLFFVKESFENMFSLCSTHMQSHPSTSAPASASGPGASGLIQKRAVPGAHPSRPQALATGVKRSAEGSKAATASKKAKLLADKKKLLIEKMEALRKKKAEAKGSGGQKINKQDSNAMEKTDIRSRPPLKKTPGASLSTKKPATSAVAKKTDVAPAQKKLATRMAQGDLRMGSETKAMADSGSGTETAKPVVEKVGGIVTKSTPIVDKKVAAVGQIGKRPMPGSGAQGIPMKKPRFSTEAQSKAPLNMETHQIKARSGISSGEIIPERVKPSFGKQSSPSVNLAVAKGSANDIGGAGSGKRGGVSTVSRNEGIAAAGGNLKSADTWIAELSEAKKATASAESRAVVAEQMTTSAKERVKQLENELNVTQEKARQEAEAKQKLIDATAATIQKGLDSIAELMKLVSDDDYGREDERLKRCDPSSVDDFYARLRTFRAQSWIFMDDEEVGAVACAMRGWHNADVGLLRSSEGAEIQVSDCEDDFDRREEERKRIEEAISSGHMLLSGWIGRKCEDDVVKLAIEKRGLSQERLRQNVGALSKVKGFSSGGMVRGVDIGTELGLCNWTVVFGDVVECEFCGRRQTGSEEKGFKVSPNAHYSFCAFGGDHWAESVRRNAAEAGLSINVVGEGEAMRD